MISSLVLFIGVGIIIVFEIAIIVFQAASQRWNFIVIGSISACFTLLNILILSPLYRALSLAMNKFSNYRTEESFERAFIVKEFILNFIISYVPLIYVAIFKVWLGSRPGKAELFLTGQEYSTH